MCDPVCVPLIQKSLEPNTAVGALVPVPPKKPSPRAPQRVLVMLMSPASSVREHGQRINCGDSVDMSTLFSQKKELVTGEIPAVMSRGLAEVNSKITIKHGPDPNVGTSEEILAGFGVSP